MLFIWVLETDMKQQYMTLLQRLNKIEKQMEKVRGCSPLTHGWQTQKYARASRKWDMLAEEKRYIIHQIENDSLKIKLER